MMIADLDPWWADPPRQAALAGLAQLSALDGAERMVVRARDVSLPADSRVAALDALHPLHPGLWLATATTMVADGTEAVRTAARAALDRLSPR